MELYYCRRASPSLALSLASDAIEVLFSPDENPSMSDGGRSIDWFAQRVGSYNFVHRAGFDDEGGSVFASKQNLVIDGYRRCGERSGHGNASSFIFNFAGLGTQAGKNTFVAHQVEIASIQDW